MWLNSQDLAHFLDPARARQNGLLWRFSNHELIAGKLSSQASGAGPETAAPTPQVGQPAGGKDVAVNGASGARLSFCMATLASRAPQRQASNALLRRFSEWLDLTWYEVMGNGTQSPAVVVDSPYYLHRQVGQVGVQGNVICPRTGGGTARQSWQMSHVASRERRNFRQWRTDNNPNISWLESWCAGAPGQF